ncbi:MAG: hypothetical protein ACR2OY_01960 [Boseongicola sp.]
MTRIAVFLAICAFTACGSDIPSSKTAARSQANETSRLSAQEARINNPGAVVCLRQVTTEEEKSILAKEDARAVAMLRDVLTREEMKRCLSDNEVVIYI